MDFTTLSACAVRGFRFACSDDCAAFPKPSRSLLSIWRKTDHAGMKSLMLTLHPSFWSLQGPNPQVIVTHTCQNDHTFIGSLCKKPTVLWSSGALEQRKGTPLLVDRDETHRNQNRP